MSVHTSIHLHGDDKASVSIGDFVGAAGLQLETEHGSLTFFFHRLDASDLAPVRDALEAALRKQRREVAPSFKIAAE